MSLYKQFLILSISLSVFASCSQNPGNHAISRKSASVTQPPVELGEQWDEENATQAEEVLSVTQELLIKRYADQSFIRRDAHPKHHGCVQAMFNVDAHTLPKELQVGIFSPDSTAANPAWVRFSNGDPNGGTGNDYDKDVRGMAIKIMNIVGTKSGTQDFVMLTGKEFFSKNLQDYAALHHAMASGALESALHFLLHPIELSKLLGSKIRPANPLQVEYFSSVPYKLGTRSMRFRAKPCPDSSIHDEVPGKDASPNYLRERLASTLLEHSACYEFQVQPNMDPDRNPVENPVDAWDETRSPYYTVATISIPVQADVASTEHLNFCENLSFDPWNSLSDTRPLGQINRARLIIYPAISRLRHEQNHIPLIEPKTLDACSGETAPLCQTPKK